MILLEKKCRIVDLRAKEVINLSDGARLGYVNDVLIDLDCGRVIAIVIPGECILWGLLGREDDYIVPWENIEKIGEDIILIRWDTPRRRKEKERRWFFK